MFWRIDNLVFGEIGGLNTFIVSSVNDEFMENCLCDLTFSQTLVNVFLCDILYMIASGFTSKILKVFTLHYNSL